MKIGVTLASGQLGTAILNEMIRALESSEIVAFARDINKVKFDNIEKRKGDYDSPSDWENSLDDINVLILISSISEPEKRIIQHKRIIDAARKSGVNKIIYTSIIGSDSDTDFAPVVRSNRQAEKDIIDSGMTYVIGRNGLYIDADVEFINQYAKAGDVWNCAGDGKCCYITRKELGQAYLNMALTDRNDGKILNLCGLPYSQQDLVDAINKICDLHLTYRYVSYTDFKANRSAALGDFYGTIIAGIYESIAKGYFDVSSDFKVASGMEPLSLTQMIESELKRLGKK